MPTKNVRSRVRRQPGKPGGEIAILPGNHRHWLDKMYCRYQRPSVAETDPVSAVRSYSASLDREVVALIASSLAYGNVTAIRGAVATVVKVMGASPSHFLKRQSKPSIRKAFQGFRYRFTSGAKFSGLLLAMRTILNDDGSLESRFEKGMPRSAPTVLPGVTAFAEYLRRRSPESLDHLIPDPSGKTAYKRLNLFVRWMVRHDDIDRGSWQCVSPAQLIVPVDVHIHRVALALGWTQRRTADIRTAIEVTRVLRQACPTDPLKYDFALVSASQRGEALPQPIDVT